MERRLFLAMVVSVAAVLGYVAVWTHFNPVVIPPPPAAASAEEPLSAPAASEPPPAAVEEPPPAAVDPWAPVAAEMGVASESRLMGPTSKDTRPRWSAVTGAAAAIRSWEILADGNVELHRDGALVRPDAARAPGEVALAVEGRVVDLGTSAWRPVPGGEVAYAARVAGGLEVTKTFVPSVPDGLHVRLAFVNHGTEPRSFRPRFLAVCGLPRKEDRQDAPFPLDGFVITRREDGSLRRVGFDLGDVEEDSVPFSDGPVLWVGIANKYFLMAARPVSPAAAPFRALWEGWGETAETRDLGCWLEGPETTLAPGAAATFVVEVAGLPRTLERVAAHPDLALAVDLGWTRAIQAPLLAILRFFHRVTGNYGVAILLLTLVVRLVLHPLTYKQQVSMARMQDKMKKLQPKLAEINERYKNNARKRAEEQMKLFKEHGNPHLVGMKGCLPLLLQMPVFFALYAVIANAVELRGAPFWLWMTDLSLPDRLMTLPSWAQIHFFIRIEDLNLLPILMTAASLVQMMLNPPPPSADPEQARQQKFTQYLMFSLMGFLFYNMASGLVLYWLASTVFGIVEYKLIRWRLDAAKAAPAAARAVR